MKRKIVLTLFSLFLIIIFTPIFGNIYNLFFGPISGGFWGPSNPEYIDRFILGYFFFFSLLLTLFVEEKKHLFFLIFLFPMIIVDFFIGGLRGLIVDFFLIFSGWLLARGILFLKKSYGKFTNGI